MDIKYAFTGSQSEFLGELAVAARIYIHRWQQEKALPN